MTDREKQIEKIINITNTNIRHLYEFSSYKNKKILSKYIKNLEQIKYFLNKINNSNIHIEKECSICLNKIKNNIILHCGHNFCLDCFYKLNIRNINTCPICRKI